MYYKPSLNESIIFTTAAAIRFIKDRAFKGILGNSNIPYFHALKPKNSRHFRESPIF
jgi:hypothetical protein